MSVHTLAIIVTGFLIALEGYSLANRDKSAGRSAKMALAIPYTIFVYWLLAKILL